MSVVVRFVIRCPLLLCLLLPVLGLAQSPPPETAVGAASTGQDERRALLEEEAEAIARERETQRRYARDLAERGSRLTPGDVTAESLRQLQRELEVTQLRSEDLRIAIGNTERRIQELRQSIRNLEARVQLLRNPAQSDEVEGDRAQLLAQAEADLVRTRESLELEELQLRNLRERVAINNERIRIVNELLQNRTALFNQRLETERRQAQDTLAGQLRQRQRELLDEILPLQERLARAEDLSPGERQLLLTRLRDAEERASLLQLDIRLAVLAAELQAPGNLLEQELVELRQLEAARNQLQAISLELAQVNDLLIRKLKLLREDLRELEAQQNLDWESIQNALEREEIVRGLLTAVAERQNRVQALAETATALAVNLESRHTALASRRLFARQALPETPQGWAALLNALANSPEVLLYQIRLSVESLGVAAAEATAWIWVGLALIELALLVGAFLLYRSLRRAVGLLRERCRQEASFTAYMALSLLLLVYRNLPLLALAWALGAALWLFPLPQPGLGILITVTVILVAARTLINLAGLLLVSQDLPLTQRPVLYRDVSLSLAMLAMVSAVVVLARLSSLAIPVVAVYDRLFMLVLLLIFVPVLRIRRVVVDMLASRYSDRPWFISLRVLSLVFPLALLVVAVLGLTGYLALAWSLGWHLMALLLVIVGWLVARGLLNDFTNYLKNLVMIHSRYGLLWTQDVINPARRLAGVLLVVGILALLLHLFDWDRDSPLLGRLWLLSDRTLLSFGDTEITVRAVVLALALAWAVFGMARWVRNVTYRWVFSGVVDLGVRNSLSVFTQYAVVLLGFLVGLHTLGLNLASLALFAGAVGVGIGFGLQTVANNFISGLLLLIERPLRSGDTVQIGDKLGTIERIGIRSLTMKTWDNTDVIIPNSDVISNAFTNWTHSDNVIRSLFYVPVPVDSDPHAVGAMMREVVEGHVEVLRDPEPLVLLWEFGKSAITFRVQYYTDFFQSHLLKVQSDIMYGVYDKLQAAGIPIQIHEQGLRIRAESEPVRLLSTSGAVQPPVLSKDLQHG